MKNPSTAKSFPPSFLSLPPSSPSEFSHQKLEALSSKADVFSTQKHTALTTGRVQLYYQC